MGSFRVNHAGQSEGAVPENKKRPLAGDRSFFPAFLISSRCLSKALARVPAICRAVSTSASCECDAFSKGQYRNHPRESFHAQRGAPRMMPRSPANGPEVCLPQAVSEDPACLQPHDDQGAVPDDVGNVNAGEAKIPKSTSVRRDNGKPVSLRLPLHTVRLRKSARPGS